MRRGWISGLMRWALCGALLFGVGLGAQESVPLTEGAENTASPDTRNWEWRLSAGHGALAEGFPSLAAGAFREVLATPDFPDERAFAVQLQLLTAYLASEQVDAAETLLATMRGPETDSERAAIALRSAWMAYLQGRSEAAGTFLEPILVSALGSEDRAWFRLLEALLQRAAGNFESANVLFTRALEAAPSPGARMHFELLRRRGELIAGEATEETVAELRMASRNLRGQVGEAEAARLLAVTLARLGRTEEAVQVIERQLERPGVLNSSWRNDFYLLMGLIAGDDSGRGRLALRQVLEGGTAEQQRQALLLLARAPFEGSFRADFRRFLGEMIGRPTASAVLDLLLATRAQLLGLERSYDLAEADVERLIEQFPGSPYFAPAHRLAAYLNWSRPSPRYRTAASYLNVLRGLVPDPEESARLTVLMGDCYFLNEDYLNASEAYGSALRSEGASSPGAILFQRVLSEIRAGRLSEAERILDAAPERIAWTSLRRWQAEWNLLDAWRAEGQYEPAFQRLRRLLGPEGAEALPEGVALRIRWLEARLTLEVDRAEETPALVDTLIAAVEATAPEALAENDRSALVSHALLLKGEALLSLGQRTEALAVFGDLRTRFPDSGPDMLSYLIEARQAASENSVVEAQSSLIALADRFPGSRYAPIALWEAALQAEQRGLDSTLREAIRTLERLLQDYPESPLIYFARLKQADLLRRLNAFGDALVIYDRLLTQYPDHPDRYRAELSRADCLFARGSQSQDNLVAASVVYERIFLDATSPLDAQVEAGYKWAATLLQRDLGDGAKEALFGAKVQYLDDPERAVRLGAKGRYWMARTLLELGRLEEEARTLESFAAARLIYRSLLDAGLPGEAVARERLAALDAG